jgi:hypothetical protein
MAATRSRPEGEDITGNESPRPAKKARTEEELEQDLEDDVQDTDTAAVEETGPARASDLYLDTVRHVISKGA